MTATVYAKRRITSCIELVRPLGKGGMGEVWLAHHSGLNQPVAVKFLLSRQQGLSAKRTRRFEREARAAGRLVHPNIVRVLDCGSLPEGLPFLVMEYVEGITLRQRLQRLGKLSGAESLAVAEGLAMALAEAHRGGVIHRDVTPNNILLCEKHGKPSLKLVDFGLAKLQDERATVTRTGDTVGTPRYMSPEQVMGGRDLDASCDLWAFAVLVYEMLTGEPPFSGPWAPAVAVAIERAEFNAPSKQAAGIPSQLDPWMAKAFHRDQKQRFGDIQTMFAGLKNALESVDTSEAFTWDWAAANPPPTDRSLEAAEVNSDEATLSHASPHSDSDRSAKIQAVAKAGTTPNWESANGDTDDSVGSSPARRKAQPLRLAFALLVVGGLLLAGAQVASTRQASPASASGDRSERSKPLLPPPRQAAGHEHNAKQAPQRAPAPDSRAPSNPIAPPPTTNSPAAAAKPARPRVAALKQRPQPPHRKARKPSTSPGGAEKQDGDAATASTRSATTPTAAPKPSPSGTSAGIVIHGVKDYGF